MKNPVRSLAAFAVSTLALAGCAATTSATPSASGASSSVAAASPASGLKAAAHATLPAEVGTFKGMTKASTAANGNKALAYSDGTTIIAATITMGGAPWSALTSQFSDPKSFGPNVVCGSLGGSAACVGHLDGGVLVVTSGAATVDAAGAMAQKLYDLL
jgi:hypothetical protein